MNWADDWRAASELERDTAAHVLRGLATEGEAWAWVALTCAEATGPGRSTGDESVRIAGCVAYLIEAAAHRKRPGQWRPTGGSVKGRESTRTAADPRPGRRGEPSPTRPPGDGDLV